MTRWPDHDHRGGPVAKAGEPLEHAGAALVMVHGRGATAHSILELGSVVGAPRLAYLAPQASRGTWYPNSFLAPLETNQPGLSTGLAALEAVVQGAMAAGLDADRIFLLGFSQGACLTARYLLEHPRRYAGVFLLTGGLPGPSRASWAADGDLGGTPVLLASGDPDPHVPWERVEETAAVLAGMGAETTLRRYPGRPHTVSAEEIAIVRRRVTEAAPR